MATPAVASNPLVLNHTTNKTPEFLQVKYTVNYYMPQSDGSVKITSVSSESKTSYQKELNVVQEKGTITSIPSITKPLRAINATDKVLAECLNVNDVFIATFRPDDNKIYFNGKELVITSEGMDQLVHIIIQGKEIISKVDLRRCGDNIENTYKLAQVLKHTAIKVIKLHCKMIGKDANAFGQAILELDQLDRSLDLSLKTRKMYHAVGEYLAIEGNTSLKVRIFKLAIDFFTKALDVDSKDPNNKETYFMRGASYSAIGLYAKAIKDFQKALKIDPNHEGSKTQLLKLERSGKTTDQK